MKQVEVTILGQTYILGCPDDGETALQQAVSMVDREMCAIRDAGKIKARERIAVLAALNLAYRLAERQSDRLTSARAAPDPSGAFPPDTTPTPGGTPPGADGESDAHLAGLIKRLDSMLAEDGRLL